MRNKKLIKQRASQDERVCMPWTRVAPRIHTREVVLNGLVVHLRLDGRGEGWRADRASWPVPMWEAIDDGDPLPTLKDARALASRWLKAAREQKTLTPRMGMETD